MPSLTRPAVLLAALAIVAGGLAGCSLFGPTAVRDGASGEVTTGGQLDVFAVQVGDCFNDAAGDEFSDLEVVPCSEPHDNEVFHEFTAPDGDFPGEDGFLELAVAACDPVFAEFVGTSYDDSSLDYWWITPTEDGWDEIDDRVVQCAVWDPSGRLSGSVEGSGR